jgi:hypothetical protein
MTSAVSRAGRAAVESGATCVAPSSVEATPWALLVSNRTGLRLIQPGLAGISSERVLVLEPVLLTGSALARTAAVLRRDGAAFISAVVGDAPYYEPNAVDLRVDQLEVLRAGGL